MVWRKSDDGTKAFLSVSPENGKFKVGTGFIQVSLSQDICLVFFITLILSGNSQQGRGSPLLPEVWREEDALHRNYQGHDGQELRTQRWLRRGGELEDLLKC